MKGIGRPLIFQTPAELESRINEYFDQCDKGEEVTEMTKRGELLTYVKPIPYTVEGLALWLDVDAVTVRRYGQRDTFCTVISRARERIFHSWIKGGLSGQYNPKIAALCLAANYRPYNIKQEINHTASTVEDILKRLSLRRDQGGAPGIGYDDPDILDADLVSNDAED